MTENQKPFGAIKEVPKVLTHSQFAGNRDYEGYERLFEYVSLQLSMIHEIVEFSYQTSLGDKAESLLSLVDFTVKNATENINSALEYEWETLGHTVIRINPNNSREILDAVRVLPQTPNEQRELEELSGFFRKMKAQESEISVLNREELDFIRTARRLESRVENFMGYIKAIEGFFKLSDTSDAVKNIFNQMIDELANRLRQSFGSNS